MRRRHLFEFEDQPWLPGWLRDDMTDFLAAVFSYLAPRAGLEEKLEILLAASAAPSLLDLASGASGPLLPIWRRLNEHREEPLRCLLTDRYPHASRGRVLAEQTAGLVTYHPHPVDARDVPAELPGARTLFTSFHHFRPVDARSILADACRRGRPIGIFEASERSLPMLAITFLVPLLVWIATAFHRPIRARRLLTTYLIPIVPMLSLWDGIVSSFRTYSPRELRELADGLGGDSWQWEAGFLPVRGLPCRVSYLLGFPVASASSSRDTDRTPQ